MELWAKQQVSWQDWRQHCCRTGSHGYFKLQIGDIPLSGAYFTIPKTACLRASSFWHCGLCNPPLPPPLPFCPALAHLRTDWAVNLGMGVSLCWEHAYIVRLCARALVLALWAVHCTPPPLFPILSSTPHSHGL